VLKGELQVSNDQIVLVDDPRLQDGMQQRWPASVVAEHVAAAVQRFQPKQVQKEEGWHPCKRQEAEHD
jgi:hypothetical protein